MSFFNKIKVNYNIKLMDDFALNKKQSELFTLIKNSKTKDKENNCYKNINLIIKLCPSHIR